MIDQPSNQTVAYTDSKGHIYKEQIHASKADCSYKLFNIVCQDSPSAALAMALKENRLCAMLAIYSLIDKAEEVIQLLQPIVELQKQSKLDTKS